MLGKISADDILKYLLLFAQKIDLTFHANCQETICMKCLILFPEKEHKKNNITLSSAEFAKGWVRII